MSEVVLARRTALLLPGALTLLAAGKASAVVAATPQRAVQLTAICASDCPAGKAWAATGLPAFEASAERHRLGFRVVELTSLLSIADRNAWPADLHRQFDQQQRQEFIFATPWFFLEREGQVVAADFGVRGWVHTMLPAIRSAVGTI